MTKTNVRKNQNTMLNPALIGDVVSTLEKHYGPIVRHDLAPQRIETTVEFVEEMPIVSGVRFAMIIHTAPEIGLDDLRGMLDRLEKYTGWEDPGFFYAGFNWRLGDGDDLGAVYMSRGKLCVWLRGWKDAQ